MLRSYSIKLPFLFIWVIGFVFEANAFIVSGTVIDAVTGGPVIGATVMVQGTAFAATTDINGNFNISGPTGPGNIIVNTPGYTYIPVPFSGAGNYQVPAYPNGFDFSNIYSRKNGDWFDGTSWSYTGHGGVPAYETPMMTGCVAHIGGGHTITLSADALVTACSLTIESGSTLDAAGHGLSLSGNFTINGSFVNGGDLTVQCFSLTINNASTTLPQFTNISIDEAGCGIGAALNLNTDIIVTGSVNFIAGGVLNTNGFIVYNCVPPTLSASNAIFTNVLGTNMTLSWTRGNGSGGVIVVARTVGTSQVLPTLGTNYTANAAFGNGGTTGTGNFVLYKGTGTSVTMTNLQPNTSYDIGVFEYNTGFCYNLSSFLGTSNNSGCADPGSPTNPVNGSYCVGDAIPSVSVNPAPSGFIVQWFDSPSGAAFPTGASISGSTNEILQPAGPGTYYASLRDINNGCSSVTRTPVTLTQNSITTVTPATQTFCSGSNTNIAVSGTSPFSWTVSPNANVTGATAGSQGSSARNISQALVNTSAVQQQLIYTISVSSGCPASPVSVNVFVDPQPVAFDVTSQGDFCMGSSGTNVLLSGSQNAIQYELLQNNVGTGITKLGTGGALSFLVNKPGTYSIQGRTPNLCSLLMNGTVQINQIDVPTLTSISGRSNVCNGYLESYDVTSNDVSTSYTWTVPSGSVIRNDGGTNISVEFISVTSSQGIIRVVGDNACGQSVPATLSLTFSTPPSISLVLPVEPYANELAQFDFSSSATISSVVWNFGDGGSSTEFSPLYTYTVGGTFDVGLSVKDGLGCSNSLSESLVVRPEATLGDFSIKNVVTANGDGKNDHLYIEDIQKFPDNEVVLLDRWGVQIFSQRGYNNEWDFRKEGKYLPAGNYVCILKLGETGEVFSRTITLIKE